MMDRSNRREDMGDCLLPTPSSARPVTKADDALPTDRERRALLCAEAELGPRGTTSNDSHAASSSRKLTDGRRGASREA